MIALAWHTARARSASLAGRFVALALGVALLAAMALTLAATIGAPARVTWFARAAVVVAGDNMVAIPSGEGQGPQALRTAGARAVPPALVGPLSGLGARAVADYAGYAAVPGALGRSVHPWPAAALHPYAWVSGGPPRQPGQLVVSAPTRLSTGDRVVAATALGPRAFTVSGVLRSPAAPAFYATGAVARRLAGGRIDAIALMTRPGYPAALLASRARAAAAGAPVRVLTGTGRAAAQPGPDPVVVQQGVALLGTASALTGSGTVAVPAGTWRLGQTATLWLTDSARVRLRVVAVLAHRIDLEQTVLLPSGLRAGHLAAPLATAVYLRMTPGAGLAGVRAAARAGGGRVTATRGLVAAANAQASRANTRALIVVLGLALVYTVIAIANTLVIATASRRAELAALRLAGATRAQVLRLAGTEAALVAALGTGLAAVVTAVTVAAVRRGLAGVAPPSGAAVPWTPLAVIGLVCLVVAVLGSVLTAAAALRDPGRTLAAAAGR